MKGPGTGRALGLVPSETLTSLRFLSQVPAFGWTTHLHTIRSFEKLTAGG